MSGFADDDEDDEPLLSGSGAVQKEWTEEELGSWADLLSKWKDVTLRPKQLPGLVRKVINQYFTTFNHQIPNNACRIDFIIPWGSYLSKTFLRSIYSEGLIFTILQ